MRKGQKIYLVFIPIFLLTFHLIFFFTSRKAEKIWLDKTIQGKINDIAIKRNDKYTFLKLDSTWYWFGTLDPIFVRNCFIGYILIKRKGEDVIWLKQDSVSKDSISVWVRSADIITKKNEIYLIERERLSWDKETENDNN